MESRKLSLIEIECICKENKRNVESEKERKGEREKVWKTGK